MSIHETIKPQVELGCNNILNRGFVVLNMPLCDISVMDKIGGLIKSRLQELDKTQDWLADKVGVSNNAVTKWIRSGKISRENAVKAAKYLEVTVDQLLGAEQRQPVNELKRQLIYFYDGMSEDHKEILLNMANNLYSLDNPHDKLAKPFSAETTTESGKIKQ